MINLTDIKTGTKLKIFFNSPMAENDSVLVEHAYFERIVKDNLIEIHSPSYVNIFPLLIEGNEFQMQVILIETIGIFACACVVESYVHDQNHRFLRARVISDFDRIQRRNDFRLDYLMKVILYKKLSESPETGEVNYEKVKSITRDLSGGGIATFSNTFFEKGETGLVSFALDDKEFKFPITIKYVEKTIDVSSYKYCLGVQFDFNFPIEKEQIIQSIFKLQRQHLMKNKQFNK